MKNKNLENLLKKIKRKGKRVFDFVKEEPLCFTYPILGNLSYVAREKIEELTGGKFSNINAFRTSGITNIPIYMVALSTVIGENNPNFPIPINPEGFLAASCYANFEGVSRIFLGGGGSILGELVSFPYTSYCALKDVD